MKKIYLIYPFILALAMILSYNCNYFGQESEENVRVINDTTLKNALADEFRANPHIAAGFIDIDVENGMVTLTGEVEHLLIKQEAAHVTSMVRGVKGVINLLDVQYVEMDDKELEKILDTIIYKDPVLEYYNILVEVDSGHVNLQGRVNSWHEKQFAGDLVKTVSGVRSVENNIAFVYDEERPDDEIRLDVTGMLRNDVRVDDGLIDVKVKNDTVILTGKVGSAAEKSLAKSLAWVTGVDTVITDNLEVSLENMDPLMRKDKYVKKDEVEIVRNIQAAFLQDPRLVKHNISIEVDNTTVTLSGTVMNRRAKKAAEQDTRNIVGVYSVINNIKVDPVYAKAPETAIDNVKVVLDHHPVLQDQDIEVSGDEQGNISLDGKVRYFYQKVQAEEVASNVEGVIDITNNLEASEGIPLALPLPPGMEELPVLTPLEIKSDEQLKEDVASHLWWSPFVDRGQVEILVDSGVVTLRGTVNTSREKDFAVQNAYEAGAASVDNQLKVDFWEF